VAAAHPVAGVGPGQAVLSWREPGGGVLVAAYAHDEYLQALAELGAVGLLLVIALAVTVGHEVAIGDRPVGAAAGAVAGLVALALHSGLDFLWHVPAIPLVAAALVGVSCRPREGARP